APILGLCFGVTIGSLLGVFWAWAFAMPAWQGLVGGLVVFPPICAFLVLSMGLRRTASEVLDNTPCWTITTLSSLDRVLLFGWCLAPAVLGIVVLAKQVFWFPRRAHRLRAYQRFEAMGARFGADPKEDRYYGVCLDGMDVDDDVLHQLRAFPELYSVS